MLKLRKTYLNIRIDADLRAELNKIAESKGLTTSTYIYLTLQSVVKMHKGGVI